MPFPKPELVNSQSPSASWPMPFPGRKLAGRALAGAIPWSRNAVLRARASQFLVPERELANSRSLIASWPMPFSGRALANAVPQARAGQFQSMIAR